MSLYLGKQRQNATAQITATHGTVLQVIRRVEGMGDKIFMDNYFTSPALFDDLFQRKINACGTVCHNRRGMPRMHFTRQTKSNCISALSTGSKTFAALTFQRKVKALSPVFLAQANTEYTVFLQEV
jgi:hypothetical protein